MRPVTAIFADIVGSTALGEQLEPHEVKAVIGSCVDAMTEAVEENGGVVTAIMGDGIAGFFGLSGAREDDPLRACLAALQILDEVSHLASADSGVSAGRPLSVRVGVNSGHVSAGLLGGEAPVRTGLGDPVNVAARLQGQAPPGAILIGEPTARLVQDRFELDVAELLGVKGRAAEVNAFRLLGRSPRPSSRPLTPWQGRQELLGRVSDVGQQVLNGRGSLLFVHGEPGVGKSRLLEEGQLAFPPEVVCLEARCSHNQFSRPFGAVLELLHRWLRVDETTPRIVVRARLSTQVGALDVSDTDLLTYLAHLLALPLSRSRQEKLSMLSTNALAQRLQEAIVAWLSALALAGPTVVVIDDFERVDSGSASVFRRAFTVCEQSRLALLFALRSGEETEGWKVLIEAFSHWSARTELLRVDPLDYVSSLSVIESVDADGHLAGAQRSSIAMRSEGVPLFLEELTRASAEATAAGTEAHAIPLSLEGVLLERIDQVHPTTRDVAGVAAVIGLRFARNLLEAVCGTEPTASSLSELLHKDLIRQDGAQSFSFRHSLLWEAAQLTLVPARKAEIHREVAAALEGTGTEDLASVAHHLIEAGDRSRAGHHLSEAARRAAMVPAPGEAIELFEQSLDLLSPVDEERHKVVEAYADLLSATGRTDEACHLLEADLEQRSIPDQRAGALLGLARARLAQGDVAGAIEGCALLEQEDCEEVLKGCASLIRARIALGEGNGWLALSLLDGTQKSLSGSDPGAELEFMSLRAGVGVYLGQFDEALDWATRAVAAAERLSDHRARLQSRRDLAIVEYVSGNVRRAATALVAVYDEATSSGHIDLAMRAVPTGIAALGVLGELDAARRTCEEALALFPESMYSGPLVVHRAYLKHEQGEDEAAMGDVRLALDPAKSPDVVTPVLSACLGAEMSLDSGDYGKARQFVDLAAGCLPSDSRADLRSLVLTLKSRLASQTNRGEEAVASSREALNGSDRLDVPGRLDYCLALGTALIEVDPVEAGEVLHKLLEDGRKFEARLVEARTLTALGLLEGRPESQHFREAREIFADCGSQLGLEQVRKAVAKTKSG